MFGSNENAILILVFILAFFLICRELVCWYFKINERNKYLKEIRDLLKHQAAVPALAQDESGGKTENNYAPAEPSTSFYRGDKL